MRYLPLVLLTLLLYSLPIKSKAAEQSPAVNELVMQLKLWESRYRTDMVNEVLDKLFNVNPDHIYGLEVYSRYQMQLGKNQQAQWAMEKIRLIDKNNPAIKRLKSLYRLSTTDRNKLQQARVLALGGRINEALHRFELLFQGPPPSPELAREYWQLMYKTPEGKDRAIAGLEALAKEYPDNTRFRLAYIESQVDAPPFTIDYIDELALLAKDPNVNLDAIRLWRKAISTLTPNPKTVAYIKDYLVFNPQDNAIHRLLGESQQTMATQEALEQSPFYQAKQQGLAALDSEDNFAAQRHLTKALVEYPQDPQIIGGLGYVMMRQGKREQAIAYFEEALGQDPDNQSQWLSLISTNRYWQYLADADVAMAEKKFKFANRYIEQAEQLIPNDMETLVYKAILAQQRNQYVKAETLFQQILARDPQNSSAIRGLLRLYADQQQSDKAQAFINSLQPNSKDNQSDFIASISSGFLQQEAEKLTDPNDQIKALTLLENALQLTPKDPWLRFDVAKRTAAAGQQQKAMALYDGLIDASTKDADLLYSNALFLSSLDLDEQALTRLSQIPRSARTPGIKQMQHRLGMTTLLQQAENTSDTSLAAKLMHQAEQLAQHNPSDHLKLSNSWQRQKHPDKALLSMQSYIDWRNTHAQPIAADVMLDYANLLIANQQTEQAVAISEQILKLYPQQVDLRLTLISRLKPTDPERANWHIQFLNDHFATLDFQQQLTLIEQISEGQPDSQVAERIDQLLLEHPLNPDLYTAAVKMNKGVIPTKMLNQYYQKAIVARRISLVLESATLDPVDNLNFADARAQLQTNLSNDDGKKLHIGEALAMLDQLEHFSDDQIRPLDQNHPSDNWQVNALNRQMVEDWERDNDYIEVGFDWSGKPGSGGQSKLNTLNIPIEANFSLEDGGRWFFRVEPVMLDAGTLNLADRDDTDRYGSLLLCSDNEEEDDENRQQCPQSPLQQKDIGASLAFGMEKGDWKFDIGTTPLGFALKDWVGGFEYSGDLGKFYWSADLSKRAVSSSLLSFAGARDPRSKRTWGGVTSQGINFGFGYDLGEAFGFWSSAGYHLIKGKQVQENSRTRLMGGVYWRLLTDTPLQLTVGLNALTWSYQKDLSEFSFGQGGYYSPQTYASLSVPIDLFGRINNFSYLLRVIPSGSKSSDKDSAFFPKDDDYQQQAGDIDDTPFYRGDGSKKFGTGMSYQGAVEWRFASRWTIGASVAIEKADFYEPSRAMIYLRYHFEPSMRPVNTPPKPVKLYQNF